MANCDDLFKEFYENIKLDSSKRDYLKRAKETLRNKIEKYFKETREETPPKFRLQGSYANGTIINPLDGEFDIDDGVYLQNLDNDPNNWQTPSTVHKWIYNAVEGHTSVDPINKRTCIRVVYSGDYHVDLPIYGTYNGETYLAENGDLGWHISDPIAVKDWFIGKVKDEGDQLRRIVRYIKAWADNKSKIGKLPSGFYLTLLAVENLYKADRDDTALGGTVRNIYDQIQSSTVVLNPVDPDEDLSEQLTESQIDNFNERLSILLNNANEALKESNREKACKIWKKEFGDRFSSCEDLDDEDVPLKTATPAILIDDARSAEKLIN